MQHAFFDNYALEYDAHFSMGAIGIAQRGIVHNYLEKILSKDTRVFEVNCGTGEDAVFISPLCDKIVCTDISPAMIDVAGKKGISLPNCCFRILPLQEISSVSEKFDLLFSNFGGLNCLNSAEIKNFAADCSKLLEKNADVILVIMGTTCLWERIYFSLKGEKQKAARRRQDKVKAEIHQSAFDVYYYSPAAITAAFKDEFEVTKILPVGFFIPPSFLDPFFARHKSLFSLLCFMDKIVRRFSFLSNYSDHYLIHLKRK